MSCQQALPFILTANKCRKVATVETVSGSRRIDNPGSRAKAGMRVMGEVRRNRSADPSFDSARTPASSTEARDDRLLARIAEQGHLVIYRGQCDVGNLPHFTDDPARRLCILP